MPDELHSSNNNLQDRYRLVIMNDDTFEEVSSYRLTRLNGYILLGLFVFGGLLFGWLLLAYTPLKRTLPGAQIDPKEVMELRGQIDTLEQLLTVQGTVIAAEKRRLSGDYDAGPGEEVDVAVQIKDVPPIKEDLALRKRYNNDGEQPPPVKKIFVSNHSNDAAQQYFIPPLSGGIVTDEFEPSAKHYGTDITARRNTPVQSVLGGIVIMADETMDTGNVIAVQHKNNLVSFYKHNAMLLKKVGNQVTAGEAIAVIGNTGEMSDGPHLHFELWYNSKPVNPRDYIEF